MRIIKVVFILILCISYTGFSQDEKFQKLKENLHESNADSLKVSAYLDLGKYIINNDLELSEVHQYLLEVNKILLNSKYDNTKHLIRYNRQSGILNKVNSNYDLALRYYYKAQKLSKQINDSVQISNDFRNISRLYASLGEDDKAIASFHQAINFFPSYQKGTIRADKITSSYLGVGFAYLRLKQYDSVSKYLNIIKDINEKYNYKPGKHYVTNLESRYYYKTQQYKKALAQQLIYFKYVNGKNMLNRTSSSSYHLAKIYLKLKNHKQALSNINKALKLSKFNGYKKRINQSYLIRSLIYESLGKIDSALLDYKHYAKGLNAEKTIQFKEIELSNVFEKNKLRDSLKFEEKRKVLLFTAQNEKLQKETYVLISVILLIILIISATYFRRKWLKTKALKERIKEEFEEKARSNQKRISDLNTNNSILSEQIEYNKAEITHLLTESVKQLKSKERIRTSLKMINSEDNSVSIRSIIADLNSETLEDRRLLFIKNHLDDLNYSFYQKLKTKHPDLTKTDLEICSYIKVGLGRKEIIKLRNTSIEAVKKSRYRIRKKMNLEPDIDLRDYISSI